MPDFPPFPVVIRRSKRLGSVLVLVTGLPLALALYQGFGQPAGIPAPASASFSGPLAFKAVFLLGVLLLLRPSRLILTPTGFTYERLLRLRRRSWRWHDVSAFGRELFGSGKGKRYAICFTSEQRRIEVPTYWELSTAEVLMLLNQGRALGRDEALGLPEAPAWLPAQPIGESIPASSGLRSWLAGGLLIGAGSLLSYLYGYKDSFLLQCVYILLVVFGWLWLLGLAISAGPSAPSSEYDGLRPATWPARLRRRAVQLGYLVGGVSWLGLLIGNLVVADWQGSQRVARVLATEPTATAVATVTALRERSGRGTIIRSTLLTYQAGTEQVNQALPGIGQYAPGQRLRVRYAVGHPDMFMVVTE